MSSGHVSAIFLFCLCAPCTAVNHKLPPLHTSSLATIPMRRYSNDCGKQRSLFAGVQSDAPGAGMHPDAYKLDTVYKDGFFGVACVKDALFHQGDKFGDGKFSYALKDKTDVSIVHYTQLVAREDREPMSHEVCFSFCRTVPEMQFFGLVNGYDCYCAPYFHSMAGDSSDCDEVCPGNPTSMCGGKFKSSLFEMHDCKDTLGNLADAVPKLTESMDALSDARGDVLKLGSNMQQAGVFWQDVAGTLGQPAPSDLMQTAKVFAGELEAAAETAQKLGLKLQTVRNAGQKLVKAGFPKTVEETTEFEALTQQAEKLTAEADDAAENLQELFQLASPKFSGKGNASAEYFQLTYFVDKKIESVYSVCGGTTTKKPMMVSSRNECAMACDADVHDCVGFSYFAMANMSPMCFLFSKFKKLTYIVDCAGFLQNTAEKKGSGGDIACYGKLSEFPSSIAPEASGKCAGCLKEANKFCKPK